MLAGLLRKILPAPGYRVLRSAGRRGRLWRRRLSGDMVGREGITAGLAESGLRRGDIVLVHSSLSSIGYVLGGAETVIDALLESVGSTGTVMVPTFPFRGPMADYVDGDPFFDVRATPSLMGEITERFRLRPEAVRSCHPTHPVAAIGPAGERLLADHLNSRYPFDRSSPFYNLIKEDGSVLLLGVGYETMTVLRTFECVVESFPLPVYLPEPVRLRVRDYSGRVRSVLTAVQDPEISARRCNSLVGERFARYGLLTTGRVGQAEARLIRVGRLLEVMRELMDRGVITYRTGERT